MTPISFALEILLDCDTIEKAHKMARKYIKELEKAQTQPISQSFTPIRNIVPAQAPSTQRILDEMTSQGSAMVGPAPMPAKVTGGLINNGDGTLGKRKW